MAGAPTSDQVKIPIETWLTTLDQKLQDSYPPSSNWRICRVPRKLQSVKKDSYSPQVISIGPFHHAADNTKHFHHHKLHYATSLLSRTPNSANSLSASANFLRRFDSTIRAYYAEKIDLSEPQFAEILIAQTAMIVAEETVRCHVAHGEEDGELEAEEAEEERVEEEDADVE
ncbi:hypothetical protein LINPERHAP2_LOCUS2045 [Linum perenne]